MEIETEIQPINSIARLYILVLKLKKSKYNDPKAAFSDIFQISDNNLLEVMNAYKDLIQLCDNSNNIIDKFCPNKDVGKKHINNTIESLSKIDFYDENLGMIKFRNNLSDSTLASLEILSTLVPSDGEILSTDKLNEIYKKMAS